MVDVFFKIIYTYGKNTNGIRIKKTGKQFKRKMSFHRKGLSAAAYLSNVEDESVRKNHIAVAKGQLFSHSTPQTSKVSKKICGLSPAGRIKSPTPDKRLKSTSSETVEIPFNYQDRKFKTSFSKRMESQYFISFSSRDVSRGALVKRQAEL